MKRAAAYARYSSTNQKDTSIETQLDEIKEYCKKKEYALIETYIDRAKSARTSDRPEFERMIIEAKKEKFDVVIIHKYDRFARNLFDSVFFENELEKHNVKIESVLEPYLSGGKEDPTKKLLKSFIVSIDEYYSGNLSRENTIKMTYLAKEAKYLGGPPPFGFKLIENEEKEKIYAVDESEAPQVREVFQLFSEGKSYGYICELFNKSERFTRTGKQWTKSTLYSILHNEKYIGNYTWKNYQKPYLPGRDDDEIIRVENALPAIIDRETWGKCVKRYSKRNNTRYRYSSEELLTGILYCDCGSKMMKDGSSKRYICARYKNKRDVEYNAMSVTKADNFVLKWISHEILSETLTEEQFVEMAKSYNMAQAEKDAKLSDSIEKLEREKEEIVEKIANAKKAILEGLFTNDMMKLSKEMQAELLNVEDKINKLKSTGQIYITAHDIMKQWNKRRMLLESDDEAQRELIKELIEKVTIHRDGYIQIIKKSVI